jgi:hypothetical protein
LKKRKDVVVLEVDYESVRKESEKPKCYNGKQPFCKKELCIDWYDSCREPTDSDTLFKTPLQFCDIILRRKL